MFSSEQFDMDAGLILRDVLEQLISDTPIQERTFEHAFRDRHSHEVGGATSESKLVLPARLVETEFQPQMMQKPEDATLADVSNFGGKMFDGATLPGHLRGSDRCSVLAESIERHDQFAPRVLLNCTDSREWVLTVGWRPELQCDVNLGEEPSSVIMLLFLIVFFAPC